MNLAIPMQSRITSARLIVQYSDHIDEQKSAEVGCKIRLQAIKWLVSNH